MIMKKDLFVRDFDGKLHAKATQIANDDGITLASIVNDAVDKWVRQREKSRHRHDLVLFADTKSLIKILSELDRNTKQNWFRAVVGQAKHPGKEFLKKHKWFDGSISPYSQFFDKPFGYANKVLSKIGSQIDNGHLLTVAFLTGDLAKERSLRKAAEFCSWYDKKHVPGITHCICPSENILSGKTEDILELFNCHNQVFIVKDDKLHRLRLTEENFFTLVV